MSYAEASELKTFVGYALDDVRAQQLVDLVSACAERIIWQTLGSAAATEVYDGPGGKTLMLRRFPVTAVASVTLTDTSGDDTLLTHLDHYRWSRNGWVTRVGGTWPSHEQAISVVYTAGHAADDAVLSAVKAIVLAAAARTAPNPQTLESLSTDGVTLNFSRAAAALAFTTDERNDLRQMRP